METETKRCPHCGEEILAMAKKCKHCHERLVDSSDPSAPPSDGTIPLPDYTLELPQIKQILGGRYELLDELGRGGMGVVYRARDIKLDTDVAVKLLPEHLARDKRGGEFMKREALASMKLSHPHILRLHNFEDHPEGKFLIMEFVEGQSLDEAQHESPAHKLPEERLVKYAIEACDGLEYAHSKGVIHRDIKPSNIMLDTDGCVKIADFGIARVVRDSESRYTGSVTSGTLLYMSPEQIRGQRCDARSDIYSFGIMMYELLSGDVPFKTGDITHQHLHEIPAPMTGVSERLNAIIMRCMEKNPERRFHSAAELKAALEGKKLPPVSKGKDLKAPGRVKPVSPSGKRMVLSAVAAILVIIALGIIGYVVYQRSTSPSPEPKPIDKVDQETIQRVAEAKASAESARDSAKNAGAETWSAEKWRIGEQELEKAKEYENGEDNDLALKAYQEATAKYGEAEAEVKKILQAKSIADRARGTMERERGEAENAGAKQHALETWRKGEKERQRGDQAYADKTFEAAETSYKSAHESYVEARTLTERRKTDIAAQEKEKDKASAAAKKILQARSIADSARKTMERARGEAETAGAKQGASEPWRKGEKERQDGDRAYADKTFEAAETSYKSAYKSYLEAGKTARAKVSVLAQVRAKEEKAEAELARKEMTTAKRIAEAEDVSVYAEQQYRNASNEERAADGLFTAGSFVEAKAKYLSARYGYESASQLAKKEKAAEEKKIAAAGEKTDDTPDALNYVSPDSRFSSTAGFGQHTRVENRFVKNADGTIYDKMLNVTWARIPGDPLEKWKDANSICSRLSIGNRWGYRLPKKSELQSLVTRESFETGYLNPRFFTLSDRQQVYWTAEKTPYFISLTSRYCVDFRSGELRHLEAANNRLPFWAVRDGR